MAPCSAAAIPLDQWFAEVHDAVGFLEAERGMRLQTLAISGEHVGGELAAALRKGPALDRAYEQPGDALAAPARLDMQAFQESHGRRAAAIDIVAAQ